MIPHTVSCGRLRLYPIRSRWAAPSAWESGLRTGPETNPSRVPVQRLTRHRWLHACLLGSPISRLRGLALAWPPYVARWQRATQISVLCNLEACGEGLRGTTESPGTQPICSKRAGCRHVVRQEPQAKPLVHCALHRAVIDAPRCLTGCRRRVLPGSMASVAPCITNMPYGASLGA